MLLLKKGNLVSLFLALVNNKNNKGKLMKLDNLKEPENVDGIIDNHIQMKNVVRLSNLS